MRSVNNKVSIFINSSVAFLLLIFIASSAKADENIAAFDSANASYAKGNFDKAIKLYESITKKNLEAPEIYFNLGNAYYKTNNVGYAILNYERAKKLAPDDEDIATNLKLASQRTEDKIEAAPRMFLTDWKNGIIDIMNEKAWSLVCILFVLLSFAMISIYIVSRNEGFKKMGFFGGLISGALTIIIFFIAQQKYESTKNSSDAIIIAGSVTVTGSPNDKGTKLFILHEGTKVIITDESADWTEIKIANGNVGWIKVNSLQKI